MKPSDFHQSEFYEDYVMGRLSEEKESLFEEHLLICDYCKSQLELTEAVIGAVGKKQKVEKSGRNRRIMLTWSIAASIILFIGLSIFFLKNPFTSKKIVTHLPETDSDTSSIQHHSVHELDASVKDNTNKNENKMKTLYSEAYQPLPTFENAIENITRSEKLAVKRPYNNQTFALNDTMEFEWEGTTEDITLAVFNNKGKLVFEKEIKSPFILERDLLNGLYYFQLETTEESLYTGKFIVRKKFRYR